MRCRATSGYGVSTRPPTLAVWICLRSRWSASTSNSGGRSHPTHPPGAKSRKINDLWRIVLCRRDVFLAEKLKRNRHLSPKIWKQSPDRLKGQVASPRATHVLPAKRQKSARPCRQSGSVSGLRRGTTNPIFRYSESRAHRSTNRTRRSTGTRSCRASAFASVPRETRSISSSTASADGPGGGSLRRC
jgi:hypothetical protein